MIVYAKSRWNRIHFKLFALWRE